MRHVLLAFCFFRFDNPALEFFCIDGIGKLGIELIRAVAKDKKVLLEGLTTVERFSDMRDRRMKILLNGFKVLIGPECLDQHLLQNSSIFAGCYVAENVSCPPRRPGVDGKLNGRIAEDLHWAEHPYCQIRDRGRWF